MGATTPSRNVDFGPLQDAVNMSMSDVFPTPPKAADFPSSPAARKILDFRRAASTPPETTNENYIRTSSKIHVGDPPAVSHLATTRDRHQLSKKRSQYYGEVFAYREPHNTAKDRVTRDSVVVAEVKLNCKVSLEKLQEPDDVNVATSSTWSRHFCLTSHFNCLRSTSARSPA